MRKGRYSLSLHVNLPESGVGHITYVLTPNSSGSSHARARLPVQRAAADSTPLYMLCFALR